MIYTIMQNEWQFYIFPLYFIKTLSYYKLMFRCNFKSDFCEIYMNRYNYKVVFWTKQYIYMYYATITTNIKF